MAALAEMDLDTLTPEQAAAARQALAALETLRAEKEAQSERIRRLEHPNLELIRLLYGKRSEKQSADERQLAFEELEGGSAEIEAAAAAEDPSPARSPKRPCPARNLGHLPDRLPRIEQVIEPESTLCPCGCGEMVRIGEDRAERLDIVPAQLRVIVTVRPKYACRRCEAGVIQAPAPARPIEGALATEGAVAHVLVSKYADHTPLYRQTRIYARSGQGHFIVRYGGGVHMLGGSSWGAFRCPSVDSGFMEAPSTSRSATAHRSLALDHDKKMVLPFGAGAGPLDAGRLGRQGGVPPRARV